MGNYTWLIIGGMCFLNILIICIQTANKLKLDVGDKLMITTNILGIVYGGVMQIISKL